MTDTTRLTRYAWASVGAALLTILLKGGAYYLTRSVGLFSDALETLVNLVAAVVTLWALHVSARPADDDNPYGHTKAEYFSSGFEGGMILIAAALIFFAGIHRIVVPVEIDHAGIGIGISLVASAINLIVAVYLFRAAKEAESVALDADAHHLVADVWTSAGVVAGIVLVTVTHIRIFDPIVAIAVALNITRTGVHLLKKSGEGLLDTALPQDTMQSILAVTARYEAQGIQFHAIRSRQAGRHRFVSMHVLVPGTWSVKCGHDLLEKLERDIHLAVPRLTVFTHLEPIEDPVSFQDITLARRLS